MIDRVDAVVIGGGLLGCAVSYYLARRGTRVLLLEKDEINAHASGQNAGSLHFQLEFRMIENGPAAAERAAEAIPLHLDAEATWAGLGDDLGEPAGVEQRGGLMLAESPAQARTLEDKVELERAWGLRTELVEGADLHELAPYLGPDVIAACHCGSEGKADARAVTPAFARAAARSGAALRTRTRVVELRRRAGGWRAVCEDGSAADADAVVVTAGTWTGQVAELADVRLPVTPVALTMMATAPDAPMISHLIQHAATRLSLKQTAEGNVLIGGGWPARLRHDRGRVDLDARASARLDSLRGNAEAAIRAVPALAGLPVLRAWTGITALVADQLPLLGAIPHRPGMYVAVGGSAFTLGPTYARLLATLVGGERPELDLSAYDPGRFGHLNFA